MLAHYHWSLALLCFLLTHVESLAGERLKGGWPPRPVIGKIDSWAVRCGPGRLRHHRLRGRRLWGAKSSVFASLHGALAAIRSEPVTTGPLGGRRPIATFVLFDAHAHLESLPPHPHPAGISGWIVPGVSLDTETRAACLAREDSRVESAVGLHPWHLPSDMEGLQLALDALTEVLSLRRPIAVGETGLDKGWRGGPMELQRAAYRAQVRL
ncbi:MAG TPA: hypothetical protein DIU15_20140, partial [Deltaproteobacteria bacterium]|nr:hypothetical protein [Deltaproteobacteria bacterium]